MINNENHYIVPIVGGPEPEIPSVATRVHDWIREQISVLVHSNSEDTTYMREIAHKLDVFPLLALNSNRWYGVQPNGDLLSFELYAPHHERIEEDQWKRAAVIFKASLQYSALKPLVPPAPLNGRPCSRCGGSGEINLKGEWVRCICQGLGWVPPMFDEINKVAKGGNDAEEKHL